MWESFGRKVGLSVASLGPVEEVEVEEEEEDGIQVLARVNHGKTHVLNFGGCVDVGVTCDGILHALCGVLGCSGVVARYLYIRPSSIVKEGRVWWVSVFTRVPVVGGKGGFGTLLKGQSKQAGAKRTVDFGACRDLNGRRLRHVNDELKLQKWRAGVTEETASSGIRNWHLPIPHWSDLHTQSSKAKRHFHYQQQRDQTQAAQQSHQHQQRIQHQQQHYQAAIQQYLSPLSTQPSSAMRHAVQQGLQASSAQPAAHSDNNKRKRSVTTHLSSSAAWCTLSGDVVVHEFKDDDKIRFHSMSEFATVALPLAYNHTHPNSIYYEITIQTAGLAQIGWATPMFQPNSQNGDGVGDDAHSYGYDGFRAEKFHNSNQYSPYAKDFTWKSNDILSCHFDANRNIQYYLNGTHLGVAFTIPNKQDHDNPNTIHIYPAISLNEGEILDVNIGPNFQFKNHIAKDSISISDYLLSIQTQHTNLTNNNNNNNNNVVSDQEEKEDQTQNNQKETPNDKKCKTTNQHPAEKRRHPDNPEDDQNESEKKQKSDDDSSMNVDSLIIGSIQDLDKYANVKELEQLGLDLLKTTLYKLGLKCGGTLQDRANRLFSIKGISSREDIPQKLRGKNFY